VDKVDDSLASWTPASQEVKCSRYRGNSSQRRRGSPWEDLC
jgi:hypothetical protein